MPTVADGADHRADNSLDADSPYDALEMRSADARDAALATALPAAIDHARRTAPAYAALLADIEPAAITSRAALATLPLTRKASLIERQRDDPPFGGLAAAPAGACSHLFASPGPVYEPATARPDFWRLARALHAAGFRRGDILHNSFAYHLTPAGFMVDSAARALGCAVIPAGTGNTEAQARTAAHFGATGYAGTPSFLRILLDKAADIGRPLTHMERALVSGEALPGALRAALAGCGVVVKQCYATADIGLIAYESVGLEGLILDESIIVEIVRPGTGDPVADGEVGEVVVTCFNPDYPLVRFATGDLSAVLPGVSPCGRTNTRIKGWMGRADQTTKIKGLFVHPGQVADVLRRHAIARGRLTVARIDGQDSMTLACEPPAGIDPATLPTLAGQIGATLQSVCTLRGTVTFVDPDSLPNDGKVIDDTRPVD